MRYGFLAWMALVALACGSAGNPDQLYVYPDGLISDQPPAQEDTVSEVSFGTPGDQREEDAVSADAPAETAGLPDAGPELPQYELHAVPDVPDVPFEEVVNDLVLPEPDLPEVEDGHQLPEVTNDCDPLGLPTQWEGTFDGEVTSNIPDMMGYTFNGPVAGKIAFEIKCINQKYVVLGTLDGGATNCALPSGCPFVAKLSGMYNPQTQHMEGAVTDAAIDYAAVIVYAEGLFDGDLVGDTQLQGNWSGEKTDIKNLLLPGISLDWVQASGAGSWTADPVEE